MSSSHRVVPSRIPSGRYSEAFQRQETSSFVLPACNMSLGSLSGRCAMRALPGGRIIATALAAFCPCSSLSKQRTTFSNDVTHSRLSFTDCTALPTPLGMETTAHLCSCIWEMVIASISPSVMMRRFPPALHSFCPKSCMSSGSPRHENCLSAPLMCCALRLRFLS